MTDDSALIFSLISLGFFGGFSHCSGMCGPFVLTQVSNLLQKTPLEKFSNFQKLKNLALLPYHAGRVTTYSLLGFLCSLFAQNIQEFSGFRFLSALFLFFASLFFLNLFCEGNFALRFKSKNLENFLSRKFLPLTPTLSHKGRGRRSGFLSHKEKVKNMVKNLFQNPRGFRGYFLGLILGFIPCGLLYGAFAISAAISSPVLAGAGMLLFGIATFPSLFLTACGGFFLTKIPEFKLVAKLVILVNAIMLFLMALKLIIL